MTGRKHRRHTAPATTSLVALVALTLATGCAASPTVSDTADSSTTGGGDVVDQTDAAIDKAGSPLTDGPVTLRVAWYGGEGRPQARVVERFAEEVATVSGGSIKIDISYGQHDAWQQFQKGAFDMLLSPTRSLDTMGVSSFDVLTLPFVVMDDDQADRVARSALVDTMMEGLTAIDATGLVFAPVYQIHLAVHGDQPLRDLSQLQTGLRIAPPSLRLEQIYQALGATPRYNLDGGDWSAAIDSGEALAAEFSTSLANVIPPPDVMATNFAVYYEFVTLMISNSALNKLEPAQRAMLETAGAAAQERSITERIREDDAFRDACAQGATFAAAPMTLVADIGRSVDQVVLAALDDPSTKRLYDQLVVAAGAHTLTWPDECRGGKVTRYQPPPPPSTTFPDGAYRIRGRTRDELLVSGVSNDQATENASDYIDVVIEDGTATGSYHYRPGHTGPNAEDCSTDVAIDNGLLVVSPGCGFEGTYTWSETDDGIALELMPTDDPAALVLATDNSAIGLSALVSVS
jgi:TRAP-type C4-dicarboxylate transport system substrate-binding protein